MNNKVVITGIGIISPLGIGIDAFWKNALKSQSVISKISRFDSSHYKYQYAGQILDFNPEFYLKKRLAKKLDPFTQYALIASQLALDDSGLDLNALDKTRIGVYVSNMFGGWDFTDRELRNLYKEGAGSINPFLATAWFPAAPQGEISIFHGLKGQSKTIDNGKVGGLTSIGYAARAIQTGRVDKVIAGGTEAMINPFMMTACASSSDSDESSQLSVSGNYQPFGLSSDGWVPGEGAAFVVLESFESAHKRNAIIYGEIKGLGHVNEAAPSHVFSLHSEGLCRSMEGALQNAEIDSSEIDLILADAAGTSINDYEESTAIKKLFKRNIPLVTAPKSMYGHMCGAAGALDIAIAALSIKHQCAIPTMNVTEIDKKHDLNVITTAPHSMVLNTILINARAHGGVNASLVIGSC